MRNLSYYDQKIKEAEAEGNKTKVNELKKLKQKKINMIKIVHGR